MYACGFRYEAIHGFMLQSEPFVKVNVSNGDSLQKITVSETNKNDSHLSPTP